MKIFLINSEVVVSDTYNSLTKNGDTVSFDASGLKDSNLYRFFISFNNMSEQEIKDNQIKLPAFAPDTRNINIIIIAVNAATEERKLFKLKEAIPLATYLQFGAPLEKVYPEVVYLMRAELRQAVAELHEAKAQLEAENERLATEGDII